MKHLVTFEMPEVVQGMCRTAEPVPVCYFLGSLHRFSVDKTMSCTTGRAKLDSVFTISWVYCISVDYNAIRLTNISTWPNKIQGSYSIYWLNTGL